MNLIDYIAIWTLTSDGTSVALSHRKVINELEGKTPSISGQDTLNLLRTENLVHVNIDGNYILTAKGIQIRKLSKDTPLVVIPKKEITSPDEWIRFRKLLSYYIACVHQQERAQEYLFQPDLNKKFLVPCLPQNWLRGLMDKMTSDIHLKITLKSKTALSSILTRSEEDEEIYIGYPMEAFIGTNGNTCYSPIGLIPIDIIDSSATSLTFHIRYADAEINQSWLNYRIPKEDQTELINILLNQHRNDDYQGTIDLKLALDPLESYAKNCEKGYFNPNNLEYVLPILQKKESKVCNSATIFIGKSLLYSKTLKKELSYIRDHVSDEELDQTSLAYIFREHPLKSTLPEKPNMPLPFIDSNQEQLQAIRESLNLTISKVTGPPGTGKSQVAVNIIANLIYHGKSVLFTSKNHKALHAIEERSHSILDKTGLDLIHFCSSEDNSISIPWYKKDLDYLIANASSFNQNPSHFIEDVAMIKEDCEQWNDLEQWDTVRSDILKKLAELTQSSERLDKTIRRQLDVSNNYQFTSSEIQQAKKYCSYLKTPPIFGFSLPSLYRYFHWKFIGLHNQINALTYFQSTYPSLHHRTLSMPRLKERLEEFIINYEKLYSIQKELPDVISQAKALPDQQKGKDILKTCLNSIIKHQLPALTFKLSSTIIELEQDTKTLDRLKSIMTMLSSAKSPYFFHRIGKQKIEEAETGFKLFARYFPGWATTLLSLTKASPCIPGLFDRVIIDEASQCEIAPIIPALFRAKGVTVIGDPHQFPPVITLRSLRHDYLKSKYDITDKDDQKFDYMLNTAYDIVSASPILLREHFRSHEEIIDFCNKEFYNGQLNIRTNSKLLNLPKGSSAVEWKDIKNSATDEINEVKKIVTQLVKNKYTGSVGVVTPFREYVNKLEEVLYPESHKLNDFLVSTANGFQGGEKDLIIFVLGYNTELKKGQKWYAEASENRYIYNVAVSRARAALIIIGDRDQCASSNVSVLRNLAKLPRKKRTEDQKVEPHFDSIWEEKFYYALKSNGINTLTQYPVLGRRLDMALICGDKKIDIEVDGVQYHTTSNGTRKLSDYFRDLQIESAGWLIERFWVYDLQQNMPKCIQRVKDRLKN